MRSLEEKVKVRESLKLEGHLDELKKTLEVMQLLDDSIIRARINSKKSEI